ncbi:MAG: glycosyltransferase family 4 protein [Actinomycetota bacterium]
MARIAFVSPVPPAETGIATYAAAVLGGLEETGFTSRHEVDRVWPLHSHIEPRIAEADLGIFQIGNNVEFHGDIYALSVHHPGVVVIHDLALDGLMWGLGQTGSPLAVPARAEAFEAAPRGADEDDPLSIPWAAQAVRRSRAVIVHSAFAKGYLEGFGCRTPVVVAPHPLVERDEQIEAARPRGAELRAGVAREGELLVGVAGDLNGSKGIGELLASLRLVTADVRVALVGRHSPHWDLDAAIRDSGVADRVTVVSDVADEDFLAWLSAFDVLVNLRFPHRGETSGSLVRALHVGVPTIVSAVGTYLEVPDAAVERIPGGEPDPAELAAAIDRLAADPGRRAAMRERAQRYAREELAPGRTAAAYEAAVDLVLAYEADPARVALARWAGALRSVGVGPQHVKRGFGLRYADALAAFRSEAGRPG